MQVVRVQTGGVNIEGVLSIPEGAASIVVFFNASGSDRHSKRNQSLAEELFEFGMGTLIIDLMTESEEEQDLQSGDLRFNISVLADRLMGLLEWIKKDTLTRQLKIGLLGTSTSAAVAFVVAGKIGFDISAVVSKGGRPDLAGESLKHVASPSLLIVGENDQPILELNQQAYRELECVKKLEIIPEAGHLFEELGTFEQAAHAARRWFLNHL